MPAAGGRGRLCETPPRPFRGPSEAPLRHSRDSRLSRSARGLGGGDGGGGDGGGGGGGPKPRGGGGTAALDAPSMCGMMCRVCTLYSQHRRVLEQPCAQYRVAPAFSVPSRELQACLAASGQSTHSMATSHARPHSARSTVHCMFTSPPLLLITGGRLRPVDDCAAAAAAASRRAAPPFASCQDLGRAQLC